MVTITGKTATVTRTYTGQFGELNFDSSNMDLILNDGATEGGIRFLNESNSDAKYQERSSELDGLVGFEPQQRGLLIRRGPGDYRIRSITVTTTNLSITNPKGYDGDPEISLADEVTSAHSWTGVQTFESAIVATGGVEGDVTGNVTGNLDGNSSGEHAGSVDVTGATLLMDAGQIQLAWLEDAILQRLCPVGSIILWSGSSLAIPTGWAICNGGSGTPNLRDRFVVGAGGTLAVGETGGDSAMSPTVTINSGGSHTHTVAGAVTGSTAAGVTLNKTMDPPVAGGGSQVVVRDASIVDPGHTHSLSGVTIDASGAHTHTATIDSFEAIPPFYALCYIMKVA